MFVKIREFELERYFAKYEFHVQYMLSPSDCEPLGLTELLGMADDECREWWSTLRLSYTEPYGHPALLTEIAKRYRHAEENGVVTAAPEEAILLTFMALLEPGDHVVAVSPAYQSLHELPRALGAEVTPWTLRLRDGRWTLDIEELFRLFRPETKVLVLNFPHNPTGFIPTEEEYLTVLDQAAKRGIFVLSDEMYRGLEHSAANVLPAACDFLPYAASLSGLSKAFALPGLRLGWLCSQDRAFLRRVASLKDYTTICMNAPGEILGIIALRNADRILDRSRRLVGGNLRLTEAVFARHPESLFWAPPLGGSTAFPKLSETIPVAEFCRRVVEERNLMVLPDTVFDVNWNHIRIGLGRRDYPAAIAVFEDFLGSCESPARG